MTARFPLNRVALLVCGLALLSPAWLRAQSPDSDAKSADAKAAKDAKAADVPRSLPQRPADWTVKTYYLQNSVQQNDANEVLVALRNVLIPTVKIFLVQSENAIVVYASPEEHRLAVGLIHDLDRPRQSYKLTYTLNETDAGKRVGTQHYSLFIVTGQRSTLKEGSKVPLSTGITPATATTAALQNFQYIDVGMNFDATVDPYAGGLRLRTKVEQSSTTEDKSISGVSEPVIRQTVLEQVAVLTPGKPANLGSIEVPGTTRRIDIEVQADPIP